MGSGGPGILPKLHSELHRMKLVFTRPAISGVIRRVGQQHLTYLSQAALGDLAAAVLDVEEKGVPGLILEAGCALGGSALVIAAAKSPTRPFNIYDTFEQIPPPTQKDGKDAEERYAQIASGNSAGIGGDVYYGYRKDLLDQVQNSFERFGLSLAMNQVHLVKGLFQDTLCIDQPVAFAHLDCDWYDSVMVCLRQIEPHLSTQGSLVIDDYFNWAGCRKAVDEYFADKRGGYQFIKKSRLLIQRR